MATSVLFIKISFREYLLIKNQFFYSDCEVHISEIEVIGEGVDIESVYRFWGQNRDKSFEGDIVESPCYIDKRTAIQELLKAKKNTPRQQWKLENYVIGKCDW